jgi:uncharacterized membrane protein SpoIIM required for sporulation
VARAISLDRNLLEYLEALTTRSYFCVYGARRRPLAVLWSFFAQRFPAAVRRARWELLVSALLLGLGALAGFALTASDVDRYYGLVDADMAQGRDPTATTEELRAVLFDEDRTAGDLLAGFASFLFTHNAQVGILCFALGFAVGIPVFYLLFYNGLLLGAMSALYHGRGLAVEWWSWILPHGVTELLAIVLCGAAGLLQARAIIVPGRHSRFAELVAAGKRAGVIVIGCVAMFFLAALLEGFFRQLVHSVPVRYAVVAGTTLLWTAYFLLAGREESR